MRPWIKSRYWISRKVAGAANIIYQTAVNGVAVKCVGKRFYDNHPDARRHDPQVYNAAVLGVGLNPKCIMQGIMLEDEGVYGSVHIGIGTNISLVSGGLCRGIFKGFEELRGCGMAVQIPGFIGVQAVGNSPTVDAFEKGADRIERFQNLLTLDRLPQVLEEILK